MCKALYVITKEKGQMPFPFRAHDADKVERGHYRYKKAVIKKEKGQIPFPTDRGLNDADKVKPGPYRDKKNINV